MAMPFPPCVPYPPPSSFFLNLRTCRCLIPISSFRLGMRKTREIDDRSIRPKKMKVILNPSLSLIRQCSVFLFKYIRWIERSMPSCKPLSSIQVSGKHNLHKDNRIGCLLRKRCASHIYYLSTSSFIAIFFVTFFIAFLHFPIWSINRSLLNWNGVVNKNLTT